MDELRLAFEATPRPWCRRWARHVADHGPGRVVASVAERRALLDNPFDLLVVNADSTVVDDATVDELHRDRVAVVAVWDPCDPETKELALRLGADSLIEADATAEEFARMVADLAGDGGPLLAALPAIQTGVAAPLFGQALPGGAGSCVVVGGPREARPEEVALELARVHAAGDGAVVLVDADEDPVLAQRVGAPVVPNIVMAADTLRDPTLGLADTLVPVPGERFWLLPGLADTSAWSELRGADVAAVLGQLAERSHRVVVQVGSSVEDLAGLGGPDRYGASRAALARADALVGVAPASPTGLARFLRWLGDARLVAPDAPVHVVVTDAPPARSRRAQILDRLDVYGVDAASVVLAPPEPRLEEAAWNGRLLRRGAFRSAVAGVAGQLAVHTGRNGHGQR